MMTKGENCLNQSAAIPNQVYYCSMIGSSSDIQTALKLEESRAE